MNTTPNPLDWCIWPHRWRGQVLGYDFGVWVAGRLLTVGSLSNPVLVKEVLGEMYHPRTITLYEEKPLAPDTPGDLHLVQWRPGRQVEGVREVFSDFGLTTGTAEIDTPQGVRTIRAGTWLRKEGDQWQER